jgi:hypothetical protein
MLHVFLLRTWLQIAGGDALPDWHIVARPPLVVANALPIPARFCVWERAGSGGPLRSRQQGVLAAWESRPVYTADMRQQVRRCGLMVWYIGVQARRLGLAWMLAHHEAHHFRMDANSPACALCIHPKGVP